MTTESDLAKKYFEGALMAYEDCAEIAKSMSKSMAGFPEMALAGGQSAELAQIAAEAGKTVALGISGAISSKRARLQEMLAQPPGRA